MILEAYWLVGQNRSWFDVCVHLCVHSNAHVAFVVEGGGGAGIGRVAAKGGRVAGGCLLCGVLGGSTSSSVFGLLVWLYLEVQELVGRRNQVVLLSLLMELILVFLLRF